MATSHRLFVCLSCRAKDEAREPRHARSGARLHAALVATSARDKSSLVIVTPVECLSACPRPCAIALRGPGKHIYVFGDLDPVRHVGEILACAAQYVAAADGFLPRELRPEPLRAGILARVPPLPRF